MQTNNTPAQAIELEQKILGGIMTDSAMLDRVVSILSPEMFFTPKYQSLYREMIRMHDAGEAIDLSTIAERVKANTELRTFTASELAELTIETLFIPITNYAYIVREKFIKRETRRIGVEMAESSMDESCDVEEVVRIANKGIDHINELASGKSLAKHIGVSIEAAIQETEKRQVKAQKGLSSGTPTGLRDFDKIMGGWQPSTLNILAARPSMGKTALMLHFAKSAAKAGHAGCIYSLEMSNISLANRIILSSCNVDIDNFRKGTLTFDEWKQIEIAQAELSKLPIYVDDNPIVSMRYIKAHSTLMRKKRQCEWIMIDYLQLADMRSDEKGRNREQEVAQASRQAKIIAKELNIPVILLSQLSRGVEQRSDKRPTLADLRESGAIEQDADTVTFIHRPAYYKNDTVETRAYGSIPSTAFGMLYIEKHRDGATGNVMFLHDTGMAKIYDYDSILHKRLAGLLGSEVQHHYETDNEEQPF